MINKSICVSITIVSLLRLSYTASVDKKEANSDTYIDALHKAHDEDAIGCMFSLIPSINEDKFS